MLSGILWSIGLLFVFKRGGTGVSAQSAALAVGALAGAIVMALVLEPTAAPDLSTLKAALPWILLAGVLFIMPVWVISLWAGRRISPARTTIIFMAEVCIGVGSTALWAGRASVGAKRQARCWCSPLPRWKWCRRGGPRKHRRWHPIAKET